MTLKKLLTYFVLWNFVLQHTLSLCAYAVKPDDGETSSSSRPHLMRVRGVLIPPSMSDYVEKARDVSKRIFEEEPSSFKNPEELSLYLPLNLGTEDLTKQALANKGRVDVLWAVKRSREWFNSPEELALYLKGPPEGFLWYQLLKARSSKQDAGFPLMKTHQPGDLKSDLTFSFKTITGGIEFLIANMAPTGEVLSKVVKEYKGEDFGVRSEEPLPLVGSLVFVPKSDGFFISLEGKLNLMVRPNAQIEVLKLNYSSTPVSIESPWTLLFNAEDATTSKVHLEAPSIVHKGGSLSAHKYEAVITEPMGVWQSSIPLAFSEFSLLGGAFSNTGTIEFEKSASINPDRFYNNGSIIGEDTGSGLSVKSLSYSNAGTLKMDTLAVVAKEAYTHTGKTTLEGDYHLTVDGSGTHQGETTSMGSLHFTGKGTFHNEGTLVGKDKVEIEGKSVRHDEKGVISSSKRVSIKGDETRVLGRFAGMQGDTVDLSQDVPVLKLFLSEDTRYDTKQLRARDRLHLVLNHDRNFDDDIETPGALEIEVLGKEKQLLLSSTLTAPRGIRIRGSHTLNIGGDDGRRGKFITNALKIEGDQVQYRRGDVEQVASMALKTTDFDVWEDLTVGQLVVQSERVMVNKKEDGALPTISTTRKAGEGEAPLKEGEVSLSLDAEELHIKDAQIVSTGPMVLRQTANRGLLLPDMLQSLSDLSIYNAGPLDVLKDLKVMRNLSLESADVIRVGKEGTLIDLESLNGSLSLSGQALQLEWAKLFGDRSISLSSKSDVYIGKGRPEARGYHFDHAYHPHSYYLPNGAFFVTNGSLSLQYDGKLLNDLGEIIASGLLVRGFEEGTFAEELHNKAGIIWIRGNADLWLKSLKNNVYPFSRHYFAPTREYPDAYVDSEESKHGHLRIDGNLMGYGELRAENTNSVLNVVGNVRLNGRAEDFVISQTNFRWSASRHHKQGSYGTPGNRGVGRHAEFVTGHALDIQTGTIDNTGAIVVGRDARFRTLQAFRSASYDFNLRQAPIVDVSLGEYLQQSTLFRINVDALDYVIQPSIPLRSSLTIIPQNILIPKGVQIGGKTLRSMMDPMALEYALAVGMTGYKERMKNPQQLLDYLQGNTTRFVQSAIKALPAPETVLFLEDGHASEVSSQLIPMDHPDKLMMQLAPLIKEPMLFWKVQMVNGIPTLEPRCMRPEHLERTGYINIGNDLSIDSDGTVHVNGGEVEADSIALHSRGLTDLRGRTETYTSESSNDHHVNHTVVIPTRVTSRGGDITAMDEDNLLTGSTKVRSGRNIAIDVGGSHYDAALEDVVETHTASRRGGKKIETTHTVATPVASEFEASNGSIRASVRGFINLQAPRISSRDGTVIESETSVTVREAHRVETHEVRTTQRGGPLQRDHRSLQVSQTGTSIGGLFEGPARVLAPSVDLTNVRATDLLEIDADDTVFRPGTTIKKHSRHEHKSDLVWTTGYSSGFESLTYDPLDLTNMRVNRGNVIVEYGAQQNLALLREQVGDGARFVRLYDQHHSYYDDYSTPGALTGALATLAINCALPGFGTTLGATMTHAAVSSSLSQAFLTGTIDPTSLGIDAITAGLVGNGKGVTGFKNHLASEFSRNFTRAAVGRAFGREIHWDDVIRASAIGAVGAAWANNIGDWYLKGDVSYAAHKGLHFGLGFGMGSLMDSDHWLEAGLSAGTAATVAEMMAEMTVGDIRAIREGRGNPSKTGSFLSQAVGTIAGSLIIEGANPMIAMMAARNAVENNYLEMVKRADGTVEIRVVDDERYPKDAMHLITEDSKTRQTKSWWTTQYVPGEETPLEGGTVRQWTGHAAEGIRVLGQEATGIMERYPTATSTVGYGLSALALGTDGYALLTACGGPQVATPVCWVTAGTIGLRHSGIIEWGAGRVGNSARSYLVSEGVPLEDAEVVGGAIGSGIGFLGQIKLGKTPRLLVTKTQERLLLPPPSHFTKMENVQSPPLSSAGAVRTFGEAGSAADALRLKASLAFQEAKYLDAHNRITKLAIRDSWKIDLAGGIADPGVVSILTRDGSKIEQWGKFTTPHVTLPNGQKLQIHFYKNTATGKVDRVMPKLNHEVKP
jgi:hypothetical protein